MNRDGRNELLVTDRENKRIDLCAFDGNGFEIEATIRECTTKYAVYKAAAADLNYNGTKEIIFQCWKPDVLNFFEYQNGSYPIVGSITPPPPKPEVMGTHNHIMVIDDIDIGDVNGDGKPDAVFCGNSGAVHVVTYDGDYVLEFNSPSSSIKGAFSQTCSVGDMTNDGLDDILVIHEEAQIYSKESGEYQKIWAEHYGRLAPVAASFADDPDNDGFTEFIFPTMYTKKVQIHENDVVGADTFEVTHTFEPLRYTTT